MTENRDTAGVIAPPPLIALAAVLIGVALDWLLPAYVLTVLLSLQVRIALGVLLMVGGVALALSGRGTFVQRKPVQAIERARNHWNFRPSAQSDVCRPGVSGRRHRHRTGIGLDAGDAGTGRIIDPFRCGQARRALPRSKIRRRLPAVQVAGAALRLAVGMALIIIENNLHPLFRSGPLLLAIATK
jgi:hypothetical protein